MAKKVVFDDRCSVYENLAIILCQLLPEEHHNRVPELIDRLKRSFHVADHWSKLWGSLTEAEQAEIVREIFVLVEPERFIRPYEP